MPATAVQLYSVRQEFTADPGATLAQLAEIGYTAVETYDPLTDPHRLRELVGEAGITICATHAPALGEQQAETLRAAEAIGVDTVIVPVSDPSVWRDRAGLEGLAADMTALARRAADHGIRVGYHNHEFELESRIGGRPALEVFADLVRPEVLLEVDIYWAAVGGVDVPDLLARLGERVRHLHVKDGPAVKGPPQTALGEGVVPVAKILAAAPDVEWHIVELDECATDMMQALRVSHAWLHGGGSR